MVQAARTSAQSARGRHSWPKEASSEWDAVQWVGSLGLHELIAAALRRPLGVDPCDGLTELAFIRSIGSEEELLLVLQSAPNLLVGLGKKLWRSVELLRMATDDDELTVLCPHDAQCASMVSEARPRAAHLLFIDNALDTLRLGYGTSQCRW